MGRGGKPAKSNAGAKRPVARKSPKNNGARVRDLEKRLAESFKREAEAQEQLQTRDRELAEALDQQTATSEILRVIASSPTDVQPVFDAIVANAAQLCGAEFSAVMRFEGGLLHLVAVNNMSPAETAAYHTVYPRSPGRQFVVGRAFVEARPVHVEDIEADPDYDPRTREIIGRAARYRTILGVPILRDGVPIGVIGCGRHKMKPFTAAQIELVKIFADQAVIAIENVRLFTETKKALERQTATSEILRIIASSPTDVRPVFETIVQSAQRLLAGHSAAVMLRIGDEIHLGAYTSTGETDDAEVRSFWPLSIRTPAVARVFIEGETEQIPDVESDPRLLEVTRTFARHRGWRSRLVVPMHQDGTVRGAIAVTRREPGAFSDEEIALLQTFADQAVIAIENVRLFTELQASNRDLTTALDKQTATSDILRVISQSPTDVQPVFDAIVQSAMRLLRAHSGMLTRIAGDQLELAAFTSIGETYDIAMRTFWPRPLHAKGAHHLAIRDRRPVNIADAASDPRVPEDGRAVVRLRDIRSVVSVPLLRHEEAIGTIAVNRQEPGGFTDDEIALLQTFADQAVIAIENVRLFNETKDALERQTATSDILRVISRSPTDVQPVFDAIAQSARRLFEANYCAVARYNGDVLRLAAHAQIAAEGVEAMERFLDGRPTRQLVLGRAVLDNAVVHISDVLADTDYDQSVARAVRFRSILGVPMRLDGAPIGAITVSRAAAGPFADRQIALLQTFADQAVIAIENVRLFNELQQKNEALTQAHAQVTETLEQQTATGEILRVIASSPTDVQPVFDAIASSAARLCRTYDVFIRRLDEDGLRLVAHHGPIAAALLVPVSPGLVSGRAVRERRTVHVVDVQAAADEFPEGARLGEEFGHRTNLSVPLLREGVPLGVIGMRRAERNSFTDQEIALLQTFADQAVIAIENVRLFKELEARTHDLTRSVDELTALGEVGRALSSTLNLEDVLQTIAKRATQLTETAGCVIWEYDKPREEFRLRVSHYTDDSDAAILPARGGVTTISKGQGLTTQVMEERQPVQIPDIAVEGAYESPVRKPLIDAGHRALLGVPLLSEDEVVGVLAVTRKTPGEFDPEVIRLLSTFANQSALAIQNARLFQDIEEKSRQLELASQHKSEFLANMSHELRTPLNAIIGFSEVLTDRMFGELNDKQEEYLKDIYSSGTHLLSLINDILDLSKIEAGRMELELTDFHLPSALDNALTLVRERAGRRDITLEMSVDERLGEVRADERKIRQVVLNLLSNAIKFTPEGGQIEVAAVPKDGFVEVSVSDTGVGIAPEDQEAVFEEFRQVGTAEKKAEGTGLGLTLCRKFIELHGGRIWVKSQPGQGSTFTFTIPGRPGE
jgi:GAF domain-containing protein